MPPGWSHTGDHHTAKRIRTEYKKNLETAIYEKAIVEELK